MRKPRVLWASLYCLLDTSSGAAIAAKEILKQLKKNGFDIQIITCSIFDNANGKIFLDEYLINNNSKENSTIVIKNEQLLHNIVLTKDHARNKINKTELHNFYTNYIKNLNNFQPDIVFYYGGGIEEWEISSQARIRNIPVMAYIGNGNYYGGRWCRDTDIILTDSNATANLYKEREGIKVVPIGAFIDPKKAVSSKKTRENVLFVNPSLEKGVIITICVAMYLEKVRPDINFEIVESRGSWTQLLNAVSKKVGRQENKLTNVTLTSHTTDMRPIYGRSRILLAPSLWWESGGRVIAEAMLNGIPVIYTDRGGMPELAGNSGLKVRLNKVMHEPPYSRLPRIELVKYISNWIISLYDDPELYKTYERQAYEHSRAKFSLPKNTNNLIQIMSPFIQDLSKDLFDYKSVAREYHRQKVDSF
jgi:glycosyltransferase involved in cell wall biosynthesis